MTALMVVLDGAQVRLVDCEWVLWDPAGFPVGCAHADSRTPDPERAMKAFAQMGSGHTALSMALAGYRVELMTQARWSRDVYPVMRGDKPPTQPLSKEK